MASILLVAGMAGCSSDDEDSNGDNTIVIGADLNSGATDTAYYRALQLRIEQVNESGQLGDRKLALRTLDNHADPTASLRNITAFADDPAVAAVIAGSCDACVVDAAKTISDKRIPTIALAASDNVTDPVADRHYVFKLGPNSTDDAAALVTELSRQRVRDVGLLVDDSLSGRDSSNALQLGLQKAKINVKVSRTIKAGAEDVSDAVSGLTAANPAAMVVLTGAEQASLAAQTFRNVGFDGKLFFGAVAAGDLFIPPAAAAATNNSTMIFTQILAIDDVVATTPAKASRKQWFRDYTSRYGTYSGVASFAADATDLIAGAVARAGGNRDRIRDILETSQVDGLSGPIRLTPDNHSGLMPQALTLLVARAGRWRLAS
ncbi:ABC transporter substrate-binding protein [Actinoplanes sp. TBRC 11911]|nr:ABC transporter substrate-binding protein [Actinoplanes sp. TBRC 11911]